MSEPLTIQSHRGPYVVTFRDDGLSALVQKAPKQALFLVDARVAQLHRNLLGPLVDGDSALLIEATEENKSLHRIEGYVDELVKRKVRRSHVLVAIGGGIIQDITCFIASTFLRGLEWRFYPTTLLAQADSCIGSKSSINVRDAKNLMGTFYPPSEICISTRVLGTLQAVDIRSGIGEMLKVHVIDGPTSFDRIAEDYARLASDGALLAHYIRRSLLIKKRYIEEDEFDRGPRNIFNYGHSFGHAIESATTFRVPHGIAVTIGMDMANYAAVGLGRMPRASFDRMHPTLSRNYADFERTPIPMDPFLAALQKDKKNIGDTLRLVLPDAEGRVSVTTCPNDEQFRATCAEYLDEVRRS